MEKDKLLKNLTDEQIAKAKQCKDPKEFLKLANEGAIELTDDQLDAVSGGEWCEHEWDCRGECSYYRGL